MHSTQLTIGHDQQGTPNAQANAKLFAAAEEMLKALQTIDANAAESVEWIRCVARKAIAKAIA
jgi:hypothetical protein